MTLEDLEGLVLEIIVSKLEPNTAAVLACVSTRLRASAAVECLWRAFCSQELDLSAPLDPDGNPCPSFKVAYQKWRESFSMYPWKLVIRAKKCWGNIKDWMSAQFPEAGETLQKGASEAEIAEVEKKLGVKLPLPTRVLYRFCNGQDTSRNAHRFPLGIIGGYWFYDYLVNVHLLPLKEIVGITRDYTARFGFPGRSKCIIVAASYYDMKLFFLNCANGQLYVGTMNLSADGEMFPCVPHALIRLVHDNETDTQQDAILLWLEEHHRRLQSGLFQLRKINKKQMICLFPETTPSCTVAVTNGVQIRASAVFVPEQSKINDESSEYWFAYSIRMSLSPEGCIVDGIQHNSCQLDSRHWIIRANDRVVSDMQGEAVVGKHPLLYPDMEEFVYQSCATLPMSSGSIEGSFTFVPGRLTCPRGKQFEVEVARVPLEVPRYIF